MVLIWAFEWFGQRTGGGERCLLVHLRSISTRHTQLLKGTKTGTLYTPSALRVVCTIFSLVVRCWDSWHTEIPACRHSLPFKCTLTLHNRGTSHSPRLPSPPLSVRSLLPLSRGGGKWNRTNSTTACFQPFAVFNHGQGSVSVVSQSVHGAENRAVESANVGHLPFSLENAWILSHSVAVRIGSPVG